MFNSLASAAFRGLGGQPAFRVYGRGRRESAWRIVDVFATHRRDSDSRWPAPLWRGTCITWTSSIVAVGWDFAESVLREQAETPASRDHPLDVAGGRLHHTERRRLENAPSFPYASEILAHELGHTWQARRLGTLYLPIGAMFTLFREGERFYHWFENEASAEGQFGGIVNDSVHPRLMRLLDL